MTDRIKEAIAALVAGKSSSFKDKIEDELSTRALDAIEVERYSAGEKFFGGDEDD